MVVAEGGRGRRTYAITDTGRAELRSWILNPPDVFVVRHEFVLRRFLLSTLDADDERAVVAEYGLRSFQTMHDWALWALDQIDQAGTTVPKTSPTDNLQNP